jgi:prevent-host-death family protein
MIIYMTEAPVLDFEDIQSLSDFQRDAKNHIRHVKATGRPSVLTVNGHAEVVVQDVKSYQRLVRRAEQAENIYHLQRSAADYRAGRVYDLDEVLDELETRHFGKTVSRKKPARRK